MEMYGFRMLWAEFPPLSVRDAPVVADPEDALIPVVVLFTVRPVVEEAVDTDELPRVPVPLFVIILPAVPPAVSYPLST